MGAMRFAARVTWSDRIGNISRITIIVNHVKPVSPGVARYDAAVHPQVERVGRRGGPNIGEKINVFVIDSRINNCNHVCSTPGGDVPSRRRLYIYAPNTL